MCGIFGIALGEETDADFEAVRSTFDLQFKYSNSRGQEASGWVVRAPEAITVHKRPIPGTKLIRSPQHRRLFGDAVRDDAGRRLRRPLMLLGHSRLVTNGAEFTNDNNQPAVRDGVVGVHNGIIVNDRRLWEELPDACPQGELDTEVLLCLIRRYCDESGSLAEAARKAFARIEGMASVALVFSDVRKLLLATNNGSLYVAGDPRGTPLLFASERYILKRVLHNRSARSLVGDAPIVRILPNEGYILDVDGGGLEKFNLVEDEGSAVGGAAAGVETPPPPRPPPAAPAAISVLPRRPDPAELIRSLRRCTRCILPETFPFIEFDNEGVCNFCRRHTPMAVQGRDALMAAVEPFRRTDGSPDCLVAFSGGRDSSYGLHYIKKELGMHPIAYTYDWGVVTDLGRRNQARLCGKLGVEHILISADIRRKRLNVRRNVEAWLKKPELGMVPLFMAGDKQFFYHANKLRRQTGVELIVFAVNPLEKTGFKSGFCGVAEAKKDMYYNFTLGRKLKIGAYYARQYLRNPWYLNRSLFDTLWAFLSAFWIPHDYLMFYDYVRWREGTINDVLIDEYDWETAADTNTTWRIGDGTVAFYNYIYHTVAGFTENDTFRSNQVREGDITREAALRHAQEENQPRWASMQWYARTIGFDLDQAVAAINSIPRLYERPSP